MDSSIRGIYIELPKADFQFISKLAKKMGWNVKTRKNILDSFIETRPKNVEISDDDILEELKAVRSSTPLPVSGKRSLT